MRLGSPPVRPRSWWREHNNKVLGAAMLVLAALIVVSHLAEHSGALHLFSLGWEDLLIGFPTAGALGMGGFVAIIWK